MTIPPRKLEEEVMMGREEAAAYDGLTRKFLDILHAGFVETVVNLAPAGGRFLDVGTGTGWIAIGVAKHSGAQVTGLDLSDDMLAVARMNAENEGVRNVEFVKGNASGIPFEDNTFDAVFCHNMLHHIPEPEGLVSEMLRVAKPEGAVVIRDLKRLSKFMTALHVNLFGLTYNDLMKKEYRDSIMASLTEEEMLALADRVGLGRNAFSRAFVTHMTLARPAKERRTDHVTVPVAAHKRLAKGFYVCKG